MTHVSTSSATGLGLSSRRNRPAPRAPRPGLRFERPALGKGAILVVEDEYLIAADLESQIRDEGRASRLALSIEAAEDELRDGPEFAGVVLDVNVGGESSFDLAQALMLAGIPFVFFTGYQGVALPDRFGTIARVAKPANWRQLKGALAAARERIRNAGLGSFRDSIEAALPALRNRARNLMRNPEEADALVELTLARAISDVADRSLRITIEDWLLSLLERTSSQGGGRLIN